ncbi:hypothetical protein E2562_026284 [Oryza meyeriana var. granulata]|uniref:Uncharacterized protein n=1 Tax=Oryza meyeriana var. granulata TaxID=110450 RepID=A0A6G1CJV9_9ORYZ|nr:hypothetical protein E2562_026284 [Oryza meyeriana var. granulata]
MARGGRRTEVAAASGWTKVTFSVLESKINELSIAELRGLEGAMTNALTVVKNKLMMKVAGGLPKTEVS